MAIEGHKMTDPSCLRQLHARLVLDAHMTLIMAHT